MGKGEVKKNAICGNEVRLVQDTKPASAMWVRAVLSNEELRSSFLLYLSYMVHSPQPPEHIAQRKLYLHVA